MNELSTLNKKVKSPAYLRIKEFLRKQIAEENLSAHAKLPSESELACKHKVSRMTARHALTELVNENVIYRINGKGSFVSSATTATSTGTVGVIMPNMGRETHFDIEHSPTHFTTLYGAQPMLGEFDYDVTIFSKKPSQFDLWTLSRSAVDSFLVLYPHKSDSRLLLDLKLCGKPFVAVNSPLLIPGMNRADFDMNHAGKTVVEHLSSKGRSSICFISDNILNYGVEWFYEGALEASNSNGLKMDRFTYSEISGSPSLDEILANNRIKYDAIVTTTDTLATRIIKILTKNGIKVPKDVAVTGYSDSLIKNNSTPTITSFRLPCERLGSTAAKLLVTCMKNNNLKDEIATVKPELVVGESG